MVPGIKHRVTSITLSTYGMLGIETHDHIIGSLQVRSSKPGPRKRKFHGSDGISMSLCWESFTGMKIVYNHGVQKPLQP